MCLFVSICLPVHPSIYLSVCPSVCSYECTPFHLSVRLYVCFSPCFYICFNKLVKFKITQNLQFKINSSYQQYLNYDTDAIRQASVTTFSLSLSLSFPFLPLQYIFNSCLSLIGTYIIKLCFSVTYSFAK